MAKPPPTPPSSDIVGANRDARVNTSDKTHPDPGGALEQAGSESTAQPDESAPSETKGG